MELKTLIQGVDQITARYCETHGIARTGDWYLLKIQEELGELTQSYLELSKQSRSRDKSPQQLQKEFRDELADVVGLLLSMASYHGMDLERALQDKWLCRLEQAAASKEAGSGDEASAAVAGSTEAEAARGSR
ncbi:hypothetical protein J31TS4_16340 [Paenibacillus sp. J31TS4]|nr:hypothetical protein J31TS4_16340 [Paenibacillus sp. J31TS4]